VILPSVVQAFDALVIRSGLCGISRHNVRLREFVPSCSRPTTTYSERQLHESLIDVGLSPAKTMALEVRAEGAVRVHRCLPLDVNVPEPCCECLFHQKWEEFNPNEMVIRVTRWEGGMSVFPGCTGWAESALTPTQSSKCGGTILCVHGIVSLHRTHHRHTNLAEAVVVKVPGDHHATVADLHAAIACSKLNIPMSYQRLIKFRDNGVAVVLKSAEAQLVKDYNVWSGEDVVVEVVMFGDDVEGASDAIKTFDATRNMIQIQFNSPQDVPASHVGPFDYDYNHTIDVSLRDCLRDVKAKIGEYVSPR
jgi:hypothetical protein